MDLEICYLILTPYEPDDSTGSLITVPRPKEAPYFYDLDIEFHSTGKLNLDIDGTSVRVFLQILDGYVWVAEARYLLKDAFGDSAVERQEAIHVGLRKTLGREAILTTTLHDEYTIVLVERIRPLPDKWIEKNTAPLARLLRSLTKPIQAADAKEFLRARVSYSERDLVGVGWSGAVIIAEDGDFQPDIELLKIGSYQFMRYRILDQEIAKRLEDLRVLVGRKNFAWRRSPRRALQAIVEQRLELVLDFEKIDQSLLLIGDWYSARVYRAIVEVFCMGDWKAAVSLKLDSLATIDKIIQENLAFSWRRVLDMTTVAGWLILLVGYFALFFLELR